MSVPDRVGDLEAYCDEEGEDSDGLLCARHDGQVVRVRFCLLVWTRYNFFKESGGVV